MIYLVKSWSIRIQKEVWLFLLFAQLTQDCPLVWTMFIKIHGKFMYNTSDSDSFHGQGHYIYCHFQHLPIGST